MNYEDLKAERNRLQALLDASACCKGKNSYKAVEAKLADVKLKIKKLFAK